MEECLPTQDGVRAPKQERQPAILMKWADKLHEQFLSCGASPGVRQNRGGRRPWCVFRHNPRDLPQVTRNSPQAPPKPPPTPTPKPELGPKLRQRRPRGRPRGGSWKRSWWCGGGPKGILEGLGEARADPAGILRAGGQKGFSPLRTYREPLGVPGEPAGRLDPANVGGHGELALRLTPEQICIFILRYVAHS